MLKIFFTLWTCSLLGSGLGVPLSVNRGPVDERDLSGVSPNLLEPTANELNSPEQNPPDQELNLQGPNLQALDNRGENAPEQSIPGRELHDQNFQEVGLQGPNLQAFVYPEENGPEQSLLAREPYDQNLQEVGLPESNIQALGNLEKNAPEQNISDQELRLQEQNLDQNSQETLGVPYLVMGRKKRDIELEDLGLEGVTFEVPPLLRINGSNLNPNLVDEKPAPAANMRNMEESQQMDIVNMPVNSCSPAPKKPISLTILLENIIPSAKSERFISTNTSQIRGSGAVLKINFCDTRTTPSNCKDSCDMLVRNADFMERDRKGDKIESKSRKSMSGEIKTDEEEEDEEELTDRNSIEDVLRKILLAGNSSSAGAREDFVNYPENAEPLALVMKPSLAQKSSSKKSTTSRTVRSNSKSPNPDQLYKLLEQLSSHLPRAKLVSLLSSLVTRISNDQIHGQCSST